MVLNFKLSMILMNTSCIGLHWDILSDMYLHLARERESHLEFNQDALRWVKQNAGMTIHYTKI